MGCIKEDMVEMSNACVDAIEEQNSALAAIKSEVDDMMTKSSEENLTKESKRIIGESSVGGSAAVRSSSAPPSSAAKTNLFCGPRNLPSFEQRKKVMNIVYASDKLNMFFEDKIEKEKANTWQAEGNEVDGGALIMKGSLGKGKGTLKAICISKRKI